MSLSFNEYSLLSLHVTSLSHEERRTTLNGPDFEFKKSCIM